MALAKGTRIFGVAAAGAALSLGLAGAASAATQPYAAPSGADVSAVLSAAHSPQAVKLADGNLRSVKHVNAAEAQVSQQAIPVYSLSPDFVRGSQVPAGRLAYFAVPASSASGTVTVQVVADRTDAGWHAASAASGTIEQQLAAKVPAGSALLNEPQVGAWYATDGSRVTLLSAAFPGLASQVGQSWTTAQYQGLVHQRYADKLAGSDYARGHSVGGFGAVSAPAPVTDDSALVWTVAAAAVCAGSAAFAFRRRRRLR